MIRFFLYYILVITSISSSFGQQKTEITKLFDKVEKFYKNDTQYCYVSSYKIYENKTSTSVVDHYSGLIFKKDKYCYQKLNSVEFVNLVDYNVIVNHDKKMVQISKITSQEGPIALKYFLNYFPKNKMIVDKNYWICELTTDEGVQKQFSKINIYINKKDCSIFKQVFYILGEQEVKKENKKVIIKNPRLEVVYQKKEHTLALNQLVSRENYFTIKNKKINLSKRFKAYKLITL